MEDFDGWVTDYDDFHRSLAGGKKQKLDYTVLSVAVLTLGLLLVVEIARHKIEHKAEGRPFFQYVLDGVYRELATLGIVEFVIFLLLTYYKGLDIDKEKVFAKVHFAFFFTAIINALQSVIVAFLSYRISYRAWVRTEELDASHYIAIRKEFDRVEAEYCSRSANFSRAKNSMGQSIRDHEAEDVVHFNVSGARSTLGDIIDTIRFPVLKRNYHRLLTIVRFHELRLHFIKANNLPLKFKVSDYLLRSQMHNLKKLVHVSTFTWLLLMGFFATGYFVFGMVGYITESASAIGLAMSCVYLGYCIGFVVVALVIFDNMKWIFSRIMHMKLIDTAADDGEHAEDDPLDTHRLFHGGHDEDVFTDDDEKSADPQDVPQLLLFWGGNPHFIIYALQFMQFGYAIAYAILLVFWTYIDVYYAPVDPELFIIVPIVSYAAFAMLCAEVVPRYTLCTSLGQLANRSRMAETWAKFKLEESKKKRRQLAERLEIQELLESRSSKDSHNEKTDEVGATSEDIGEMKGELRPSLSMKQTSTKGDLRQSLGTKPASASVLMKQQSTRRGLVRQDSDAGSNKSSSSNNLEELTKLVTTKTGDLDAVELPSRAADTAAARKERRKKLRSMSDGVASMRLGRVSSAAENELKSAEDEVSPSPSTTDDNAETTKKPSSTGVPEKPSSTGVPEKPKRERSRRKKAKSEGVALMKMASDNALFGPGEEGEPVETASDDGDTSKSTSKIGSRGVLKPLLEEIPARTEEASKIPVVLGRGQTPETDSQVAEKQLPPAVSTNTEGAEVASPPDAASALTSPVKTPIVLKEKTGSVKSGGSGPGDDGTEDTESDDELPAAVRELHKHEPKEAIPLSQRLRRFFLSSGYRVASGVFGTIGVFFMVGMRVEVLLVAEKVIKDNANTFDFDESLAFWIEAAFYGVFVVISSLIISLFSGNKDSRKDLVIASVFDISLSAVCLAVLVVAEASRCDGGYDKCAAFAHRHKKGLGNIEPFTALIVLRIFRFQLGQWLAEKMSHQHTKKASTLTSSIGLNRGPDYHGMEHSGHSHGQSHGGHSHGGHHDGPFEHQKGTIVDLWRTAVATYPDVVEKYGEFSGELLETMLGLQIMELHHESNDVSKDIDEHTAEGRGNAEKTAAASNLEGELLQVDPKHANLRPEAQAIIIAGKVGKPMCIVSDASQSSSKDALTSGCAANFEVDHNEDYNERQYDEFGVGEAEQEEESFSFIAPNANLIRAMRRCERKLPPMLQNWTVVDVVMTKFEIVLFEAVDIDDDSDPIGMLTLDANVHMKRLAVRDALSGLKGGCGLRLRDVAAGRRVVGHLDLSSIETVNLERIMPDMVIHDDRKRRDDEGEADSWKLEFWRDRHHERQHEIMGWRHCQWERTVEERLKLKSPQGVLYLRYFCDLEAVDRDTDTGGIAPKKGAVHWCRTVARLVGGEQLKQKLDHVGEDEIGELEDFLEVVPRSSLEDHHHGLHFRRKTRGYRRAVTLLSDPPAATTIATTSSPGSRGTRDDLDLELQQPRSVRFALEDDDDEKQKKQRRDVAEMYFLT